MTAVPPGLRSAFVETAFPTLKRGANEPCAYGAGNELLPAWSASTQAPLGGNER
jgi:hypothetical protein